MKRINVGIILLGYHSRIFDIEVIKNHSSKIFLVSNVKTVTHLPEMDGEQWNHTCQQLAEVVIKDDADDFVIGITANMLDDNYYIKRIGDDSCVMSYYGLIDQIRESGNTVENFILRNIYELVVIFNECKNSLANGDTSFIHEDTRGCLFDLNGIKTNVIYSLNSPILCEQCKARLNSKALPNGFVELVENEIAKIKKPKYNRVIDWIKENPWKSFMITSLWAIILNVIASYIFDLIKRA